MKNHSPLFISILSVMSVAAAFGQAVVYSADDGTAETSYGVIPASSAIVWMNRFTAAAGANVITAIDVAFGRYFGGSGMLNGAPVALYVWSDPNNDGNPSDGQVLASATGVTANVDTNIFNRYSIGPVVVPVGSNFFVGAIYQESGYQYPAAMDLNSPKQHRSWLGGWGPGIPPNPNDLGPRMLDMGSHGNFLVRAVALCSYSIAPTSKFFGPSGGRGDIVVTTTGGCPWTATSGAGWVTLNLGAGTGPGFVSYSVAANPNAGQRSATVAIGGSTFTVTQAGLASCTYSIKPTSQTFGVAGGSATVNVTAPSGCGWTASSNVPWAGISSGSSGSGSGLVVVQVAANSAGPRSGTLTIAGKTFRADQAASACGATDVTDKVSVYQGPTFGVPPLLNFNSQEVSLWNTSEQVIPAPVYLITDGLPRTGTSRCRSGCWMHPSPPITYCQSANGSYLVPFSSTPLAPGEWIKRTLLFLPFAGDFHYTPRVVSGTPSQ